MWVCNNQKKTERVLYIVKRIPQQLFIPVAEGWHIEWQDNDAITVRFASETVAVGSSSLIVMGLIPGLHRFSIQTYDAAGVFRGSVVLVCHVFRLELETDANRDGEICHHEPQADSWIWGENGYGAILMVNRNQQPSDLVMTMKRLSRLTRLRVRSLEYENGQIPPEVELVLYVTPNAARRISVYRRCGDKLTLLLGKFLSIQESYIVLSQPLDPNGEELFVECLEYPGIGFEGLVTLELQLRVLRSRRHFHDQDDLRPDPDHPGTFRNEPDYVAALAPESEVIGVECAVMRATPWIATPDNLAPTRVYAGMDSNNSNTKFIDDLTAICTELGVELTVLSKEDDNNNFWIQDSVQFGYSQTPEKTLNVVCTSIGRVPTNINVLGDDLALMALGSASGVGGNMGSSLDLFGNLECSPPVSLDSVESADSTCSRRQYPFGRIIFGGRGYSENPKFRTMLPDLRRFLYAQKIQSPIELFSDWLEIGHVDEMISFVPVDRKHGDKHFKLLIGSPALAINLISHAYTVNPNVTLFKNMTRGTSQKPIPAEMAAMVLLNDEELLEVNAYCQRQLDFNRSILKRELDLTESDIIDIPTLFTDLDLSLNPPRMFTYNRVGALMPNMVNHLVLGNTSVMPRPYGPEIQGRCLFEQEVSKSMGRIGRDVKFINDWFPYYLGGGDVHCATNVRREPFKYAWWAYRPDDVFDVLAGDTLSGRETVDIDRE